MDSNDFNKYGIPSQKKFPMPDADHVRSAIKFFNYASPQYEKILARAILQRAKEYGVDLLEMSIGDENRFKKYLPKNELKHNDEGQKLNKDFYDDLPGIVCAQLDKLITEHGDQSWFPKAWNEYRQHVLTSDRVRIRMPGFIFNKYL